MTIETATKISQLNAAGPPGTDPKSEGDNHIRLIKGCLQSVFDDSGTTLKTTLPIEPAAYANVPALWQRGLLYGSQLANNGTLAVDLQPGTVSTDDAIPVLMDQAATITKRLDAVWAVGSGNGGLDTGVASDTTYHVWRIQRSDTGVVDGLLSLSATAPVMPANYNRKRRLGSVIRSGGVIRPFRQYGDEFHYVTGISDRSSTATVAASLITLSVPTGIVVKPILALYFIASGTINTNNYMGDGAAAGTTATVQTLYSGTANGAADSTNVNIFYTNTSGQIWFACAGTGTITGNGITTHGWIDRRGQQ